MSDQGWENGPTADAVLAAVGGSENLDKPPRRRILLTLRCRKGDKLGRVISTRIGPVWIARLNRGLLPSQLSALKQRGMSAPGNTEWMFQPLTDPLVRARCRCGDVSRTGVTRRAGAGARTPERVLINFQSDAIRAEIAAGTRELVVDDNGLPVSRAR